MNCIRKNSYCDKSFTEEVSQVGFFTHVNIEDLVNKCTKNQENVIRFRTIGIIESVDGNFFIKDLNSVGKSDAPSILLSMVYMKRPLQNTILPYAAQLFGTIQWKNRPIIYANMIQVLTTANALRLNDAITTIAKCHLAKI